MRLFVLFITVAAAVVGFSKARLLAADEWPQFRGPDGQGHADGAKLPLTWSESEHV